MLTRHTRKFLNFIEKSTVNFKNKVVLFSYIHENFPDNESSINATLVISFRKAISGCLISVKSQKVLY